MHACGLTIRRLRAFVFSSCRVVPSLWCGVQVSHRPLVVASLMQSCILRSHCDGLQKLPLTIVLVSLAPCCPSHLPDLVDWYVSSEQTSPGASAV